MLNLFFRKNFYDGWDNVMFFLVPNIIVDLLVIVCTALCIPGVTIFKETSWYLYIWIALVLIFSMGCGVLSVAWAETTRKIADYETYELKDFFKTIKSCISDGCKYGASILVVLLLAAFNIRYFLFPKGDGQTVTFAGFLAGAVYVWVAIFIMMSLNWYPALRACMHNSYRKSIKKCFIITFDNLYATIFISIYEVILCAISIIMLGIAPGMAGLVMSRSNAIRLILKKYDYLEELEKSSQAEGKKISRKIPWDEILKEEYEANPVRSFKSFWMPWKDNQ